MAASTASTGPWWKFGHVWLIVSGPALVVVASMFTLYLAITRPDPVTDDDYYRKGLALSQKAQPADLAPAEAARNHAATGVVPTK